MDIASLTPRKKIDYSKVYSPSRLSMFEKCPRQYYFYYIDSRLRIAKYELKKLPENIWKFYTIGRAIHDAITLFYYLPLAQRDENNLIKGLRQTWRSEIKPYFKPPLRSWGGFKTIEEEREGYKQSQLMLRNFFKLAAINPSIAFLPTNNFQKSIEDFNKTVKPLTEKVDIGGKFDLIVSEEDGELHIIDFKTGKNDKADPFQLMFYKVLAEMLLQKRVKKASFYFLLSGNVYPETFLRQSNEEIVIKIKQKIFAIQKEKEFAPKPSKLCLYCLFKDFCPAKKQVKEILHDVKEEDIDSDLPF